MWAGVGGTFNTLHRGHELLFETAFSVGDAVEVGLTSDRLARSTKTVAVLPYPVREANLSKYLQRFGKPFEIVGIDDELGTAATSDRLEALVVSPETRRNGDMINEVRRRHGLKPLKIVCIREVKADDSGLISSTRILQGDIDRDGRLLRPVRVAVGSTNDVKVNAVRYVFTQVYGLVEVVSVEPNHGVEGQPREERVIEGAIERAKNAISSTGADFGVGVEAGLFFSKPLGRYLDSQYCAIVDSSGHLTVGHGPGFEYPPEVIKSVMAGRTVGETMSMITGIENIGHKSGSIGYLSDGLMDRTSLTEVAVLMALVPRVRPELYTGGDRQCPSSATASR